MMLRFAGAVLLVLCGALAGRAAAQRTVQRCAALDETIALLDRIEQEIRYCRQPLPAVLAWLRASPPQYFSISPQCCALQQLAPPEILAPEERACFSDCFGGMGHGAAEQECSRIRCYRERFAAYRAAAGEQAQLARRLYPRIGLGIGAMAAVFVL
jgi:hypothetical protein